MTLARKGSRRIRVGAVNYRWTVSPDDEPGLGIVVEDANSPAQRLVSWMSHGAVVSPRLVKRAILDGLASGWQPRQSGADFVRRIDELSRSVRGPTSEE